MNLLVYRRSTFFPPTEYNRTWNCLKKMEKTNLRNLFSKALENAQYRIPSSNIYFEEGELTIGLPLLFERKLHKGRG